jgi:hypothetical protein
MDGGLSVMKRRMTRSVLGLAGLALLAAVLLVGAVLAPSLVDGAPTALRSPGPLTVPVDTQEFDDPISATLHARVEPVSAVRSPVSGTVTYSACVPGTDISSGQLIGRVNDAPVVVLATSSPLWRDLRPGDRGLDVSSLQQELARLGFAAPGTGVFDRATRAAVATFFAHADPAIPPPGSVLLLASTAWSPAPMVTATSCHLEQGATIASGDVLARLAPRVAAFSISSSGSSAPGVSTPDNSALSGARVVVVAGVAVPTEADGSITNPDDVVLLGQQDAVRRWLGSDRIDDGLPATWRLAEPVSVAVVPPASLIGVDGHSACVISADGPTVSVTVVSSMLGRTLVVPEDSAARLPSEVRIDGDGRAPCP